MYTCMYILLEIISYILQHSYIASYVAIHTMNIINLIYPTIGICKKAKPVEQGVTTFTKT